MKEILNQLEQLLNEKEVDLVKIKELKQKLLKDHIKGLKIDNYIGDYPTFMEPVILGDKVKIGDDVLIGPKVYIGNNSEIEDYAEISNCIIFDNVKIGNNFKLDNCIILKDTKLHFNNFSNQNSILKGIAENRDKVEIISL
ncbi:MAG: GlgC family sugar phosphate nucleotidyltransferase [Promethearchaeota archaeon]|jgi:NDP-sugar pyrophosphorylase family protein